MITRETLAALRTIPRQTAAQQAYVAAFEALLESAGQERRQAHYDVLNASWIALTETEQAPIAHIFVQLGWKRSGER